MYMSPRVDTSDLPEDVLVSTNGMQLVHMFCNTVAVDISVIKSGENVFLPPCLLPPAFPACYSLPLQPCRPFAFTASCRLHGDAKHTRLLSSNSLWLVCLLACIPGSCTGMSIPISLVQMHFHAGSDSSSLVQSIYQFVN